MCHMLVEESVCDVNSRRSQTALVSTDGGAKRLEARNLGVGANSGQAQDVSLIVEHGGGGAASYPTVPAPSRFEEWSSYTAPAERAGQ